MNLEANYKYIIEYALLCLFLHILVLASALITVFSRWKQSPLNKYVVETLPECLQMCEFLIQDTRNMKVLGIDAEWVTMEKFRQPVALLQLCSTKGNCGLFRINKMKEIPASLKNILEDDTIVKVGVVPEHDASLIFNDYGVVINSTLDLRHLTKTTSGLAGLAEKILNVQLDKNYRLRCSDWQADKLNELQIHYAAMDAYVSIEIFKKLTNLTMNPISRIFKKPPSWESVMAHVNPFLDQKFRVSLARTIATESADYDKSRNIWQTKGNKLARFLSKKEVIYDNCFMRAPDDTLLCTVRKSKAEWYLKGGRAELISQEPFTIRLLFEPKRKPAADENLYEKELKSDQCVVCGSKNQLLKHSVVPRTYCKQFPVHMKSHCSHDIVVFCARCHLQAGPADHALMEKLERQAGWKKKENNKETDSRNLQKYAKALLKHRNNIPEERCSQMEQAICEKYNVDSVTHELLTELANGKDSARNDSVATGSEVVVKHFTQDGRTLADLQTLWRQHFIDTMRPQFLPKHWSVRHRNT